MKKFSSRLALIIALNIFWPMAVGAHETLYTVEFNRAVAVKAYFADGEVLAYVPYELYSPLDQKIPYQKGRTDRGGYIAFVPDVSGKWRLRIIDAAGHGLDTTIEVPTLGKWQNNPTTSPALPALAYILRPLLGLIVVGAIFIILTLVYRRRGSKNEISK